MVPDLDLRRRLQLQLHGFKVVHEFLNLVPVDDLLVNTVHFESFDVAFDQGH